MKVKHAHSSSLYSRSAQSLKRQVDDAVDDEGPQPTVLTFTEVGAQNRENVLRDASKDFGSWQPDITDVATMWSKEEFEPTWREAHKLTDLVWHDGHGREHETYCGSILLEHHGGQTVFVSVCHTPSHVQNGHVYYQNAQARAWRAAMKGWGDYWRYQRKKHKPDLGLIVADWNVDFHSATWRKRVREFFPGLANGWTQHLPPKGHGTHGARLIDGTLGTVVPNRAFLLPDDASSDHRPYGDIWTVPKRAPKR